LHKPSRTVRPVEIDYLGFTVEDVFVVGYGLDYGERYRNVPYVGVLRST
jgi:hypoxanthine phosphoribosyltransferase